MEYKVVRQKRKTLVATIKDAQVIVKAPYFVSKEVIEAFVQKYASFLQQRLAALQECKTLYYLGESFVLQECKDGWRFDGKHFFSDAKKQKNIEEFLRQEAKKYIPKRVEYFAKQFGESYKRITITKARTRWGSCSSKKTLNFSYQVMMLPPHLIDYIIIHELSHLSHMNHSKAFWALVEARCPEYKEREKELKEFAKRVFVNGL